MITIVQDDVIEFCRRYVQEGREPFHAFLSDPPYHYTSITKRFGSPNAKPAKGKGYSNVSRGFMGKSWDGGAIAFQPETWAAFASVLYPGAFGMAYASTRGWHRMASAIEQAGFIIHPTILAWTFGSGFPKATRIDKQIDQELGADRPKKRHPAHKGTFHGLMDTRPWVELALEQGYYEADAGQAVTPEAQLWESHRYGLAALKPAFEPVIVFQKPYSTKKKVYKQIQETGAGALNMASNGGRWPTNLALVHHPLCSTDGCYQECVVLQMGDRADYFYQADYDLRDALEAGWKGYYCPKASRPEREAGLPVADDGKIANVHPSVKPLQLNRHWAALLCPPEHIDSRLFNPFGGVCSEGIGGVWGGFKSVVSVEFDPAYVALAKQRAAYWLQIIAAERAEAARQKAEKLPGFDPDPVPEYRQIGFWGGDEN